MAKQKSTHCPLCATELATINVAPCQECGHLPEEIEHALSGKHTYAEMRIFGNLNLILCDFCQVDFGSFQPEYFGLPHDANIDYGKMQLVREVPEIFIGQDKSCPQCNLRLKFVKFVIAAREFHGASD